MINRDCAYFYENILPSTNPICAIDALCATKGFDRGEWFDCEGCKFYKSKYNDDNVKNWEIANKAVNAVFECLSEEHKKEVKNIIAKYKAEDVKKETLDLFNAILNNDKIDYTERLNIISKICKILIGKECR